jgi:hypothetical protein
MNSCRFDGSCESSSVPVQNPPNVQNSIESIVHDSLDSAIVPDTKLIAASQKHQQQMKSQNSKYASNASDQEHFLTLVSQLGLDGSRRPAPLFKKGDIVIVKEGRAHPSQQDWMPERPSGRVGQVMIPKYEKTYQVEFSIVEDGHFRFYDEADLELVDPSSATLLQKGDYVSRTIDGALQYGVVEEIFGIAKLDVRVEFIGADGTHTLVLVPAHTLVKTDLKFTELPLQRGDFVTRIVDGTSQTGIVDHIYSRIEILVWFPALLDLIIVSEHVLAKKELPSAEDVENSIALLAARATLASPPL